MRAPRTTARSALPPPRLPNKLPSFRVPCVPTCARYPHRTGGPLARILELVRPSFGTPMATEPQDPTTAARVDAVDQAPAHEDGPSAESPSSPGPAPGWRAPLRKFFGWVRRRLAKPAKRQHTTVTAACETADGVAAPQGVGCPETVSTPIGDKRPVTATGKQRSGGACLAIRTRVRTCAALRARTRQEPSRVSPPSRASPPSPDPRTPLSPRSFRPTPSRPHTPTRSRSSVCIHVGGAPAPAQAKLEAALTRGVSTCDRKGANVPSARRGFGGRFALCGRCADGPSMISCRAMSPGACARASRRMRTPHDRAPLHPAPDSLP